VWRILLTGVPLVIPQQYHLTIGFGQGGDGFFQTDNLPGGRAALAMMDSVTSPNPAGDASGNAVVPWRPVRRCPAARSKTDSGFRSFFKDRKALTNDSCAASSTCLPSRSRPGQVGEQRFLITSPPARGNLPDVIRGNARTYSLSVKSMQCTVRANSYRHSIVKSGTVLRQKNGNFFIAM